MPGIFRAGQEKNISSPEVWKDDTDVIGYDAYHDTGNAI